MGRICESCQQRWKDGVGCAHRVTSAYHGELGAEKYRRSMGDIGDILSAGLSGDSVGGYAHWLQAGDSIPVGGAETYLWVLHKVEGLRGRVVGGAWWRQEAPGVMLRGSL